ncbi:MAG: hypothetical protein J6S21_03560 [Victivallales bacterium]|nr:hypothetical protein [Victivallales bacterium]
MKSTSPSFRRRRFTFMELIIAVSILMMVALALFAYSRSVTVSWAQMVDHRNRFNEMLNLDRAVDKALSGMIPFVWRDADGEEYPFIVAEENGLRFAYLHAMHDADEGAIRFAEFQVEDECLYMVYTDRPFYDWAEAEGRIQRVLLAEGIAGISFAYVDWSEDTDSDWSGRMLWQSQWETTESQRTDIPLGVLMTVYWLDGRTECWMRRTMGNSYRERYGKWDPQENTEGWQ